MELKKIGHMAMFVVKSIVIQNDGQGYGSINPIRYSPIIHENSI